MSEPSPEITVRAAEPCDRPDLDAIRKDSLETLRKFYAPNSRAPALAESSPRFTRRLAAVRRTRVIGVLEYYLESDALCLMSLGVLSAYRRCGVARSLIERAEGIAETGGITRVSLWTVSETGNVTVFARLGYRVRETQVSELFAGPNGECVHEVRMEKKLLSSAE